MFFLKVLKVKANFIKVKYEFMNLNLNLKNLSNLLIILSDATGNKIFLNYLF